MPFQRSNSVAERCGLSTRPDSKRGVYLSSGHHANGNPWLWDRIYIQEYPKGTLVQANTIGELTTDPITMQSKPDLTKYFYDPNTGMLFFYVAQTYPNAQGPSPLGACSGADGRSVLLPRSEWRRIFTMSARRRDARPMW